MTSVKWSEKGADLADRCATFLVHGSRGAAFGLRWAALCYRWAVRCLVLADLAAREAQALDILLQWADAILHQHDTCQIKFGFIDYPKL
jgi:hypothetical protein